MINLQNGIRQSFGNHPQANVIADVLAAAFGAVEPSAVVSNYLQEHPIPSAKKTYLFGLGKAACAMARAFSGTIAFSNSLIITKSGSLVDLEPVTIIEGNHPIPGINSLKAGESAKEFLSQLTKDDLLICLISGGGSALMTAPRVPLEDLQALTSALLACGASIEEMNILRRHLDELKGGGVAALANGAKVVSLIMSDVVGDSLEAIASGPTAPDPTSVADALLIIDKYRLQNKIPKSIIPALRETLKEDDPSFADIQNIIIASNSVALNAARAKAALLGFQTFVLDSELQGEARDMGRRIALQLKEYLERFPHPFCLLAGGETTVTLNGNGKGGRNQEFVMGALAELADLQNIMLLSIATDGEDGPTNAAGAYVTGESFRDAMSMGLNLTDYASRNDSYYLFEKLGSLIYTGSSGTNVNDLVVCFVFAND